MPRLDTSGMVWLQAGLFNPSFMGNGKWCLVSACNRVAVTAVQPDRSVVPKALELIRTAVQKPDLDERDMRALKPLLDKGIVRSTEARPLSGTVRRFTDWYQDYVSNYPFFDYAMPGWLEADHARMHSYLAAGEPPPRTTPRRGGTWVPPEPGEDLISRRLRTMADAARCACRRRSDIPGYPVGPWCHKAVPSGGARHPTEVWLHLPEGRDPSGWVAYDVDADSWIRTDVAPISWSPPVPMLILTSRVERPMWRYREPRSWRPVLIDAGHVDQVIRTMCAQSSLQLTEIPLYLRDPWDNPSEPVLVSYVAEEDAAMVERPAADTHRDVASPDIPEGSSALTSPLLWGTVDADGIKAAVAHRPGESVLLDDLDFALLTYCLPSRRNDRPSDAESLTRIFGNGALERRQRLSRSGLLLTQPAVLELLTTSADWPKFGWYLSLVAHEEAVASSRRSASRHGGRYRTSKLVHAHQDGYDELLDRRRTCRRFQRRGPDQWDIIRRHVHAAVAAAEEEHLMTYIINTHGALDDERPVLIWNQHGWDESSVSLSRERIRDATVGQGPSGAGEATMWLVADVFGCEPHDYERRIRMLGAVAQDILASAVLLDLQAFISPAVTDELFESLVGRPSSHTVVYTMTLGVPA